jgi:hypothetical protein
MRYLFLLLFAVLTSLAAKAQEEDYLIEMNGKEMPVSLDKEYKVPVNGKTVSFTIRAKDTLQYNGGLFSFKYTKDLKISKMTISEGIEQVMLITSGGSGFIIQEYASIDPTMLNEMMIKEVTKESVSYGYEMERKDYDRKLLSGQEINVDKAVLTYKDEINVYEVATMAGRDNGILVMTMMMSEEFNEKDANVIELMWRTLKFK